MPAKRTATLTADEQAIKTNIEAAIRQLRADGTVAMSMDNLRQVTPTTGVRLPVSTYPQVLASIASEVAKRMKFSVRFAR